MAKVVKTKTLTFKNEHTGKNEKARFKIFQKGENHYVTGVEILRGNKVSSRMIDDYTVYPSKSAAEKELDKWVEFFKDMNPHLKPVRSKNKSTTKRKNRKKKSARRRRR